MVWYGFFLVLSSSFFYNPSRGMTIGGIRILNNAIDLLRFQLIQYIFITDNKVFEIVNSLRNENLQLSVQNEKLKLEGNDGKPLNATGILFYILVIYYTLVI